MRRTLEVMAVVAAMAVGAVALGFSRDQGTPQGTPPLQKYHIKPGDLPPPTNGVANPPEVVDKPADAQLRLPAGFAIDVFADGAGFQTLRNLIEAPNGDLFAAERLLLRWEHRQRGAVEVGAGRADARRHAREDCHAAGRRQPLDADPRVQRGRQQAVCHRGLGLERRRRTVAARIDSRDEP